MRCKVGGENDKKDQYEKDKEKKTDQIKQKPERIRLPGRYAVRNNGCYVRLDAFRALLKPYPNGEKSVIIKCNLRL